MRRLAIGCLALVPLSACGAASEDGDGALGSVAQAVTAPSQAQCSINVEGKGVKDLEKDYLPHVIQCENGGAKLEALKAQAIAARSVAYYGILTKGSICDSQGCQVYSCGATPSALHHQAVQETAGIILTYANTLTYGFFVAGSSNASPPSCHGSGGSTEKYVTYNSGKSGTSVTQTSLGYVGPPGFGQNRGCMSQWGARCLENSNGYDYKQILQFYYGADIGITQTSGSCIVPPNTPPKGYLDAADCDGVRGWAQDPDAPTKSIDVHVYFGGPAGSGAQGVPTRADVSRNDLCSAIGSCEHGFELPAPLSLFDGEAHDIHAYGIDSAGGSNAQLSSSPMQLKCAAKIPAGVKRHVTNSDSFAAWSFDNFWDVMPVGDAALDAVAEDAPLPAGPQLAQQDGDPAVWLLDSGFKRHVPNPAVMDAWGFAAADVKKVSASEIDALPQGPDVRSAPILVKSSGPAVYVMDDALPQPGSGGSAAGGAAGTGSAGSASGGSGALSSGGSGALNSSTRTSTDEGAGCSMSSRGGPSGAWLLSLLGLPLLRRPRRRP